MITIASAALPIHVWASKADLVGFEEALAQARNLANHPLAKLHVALMPDFHVGYGMPIGGVFATRGGVVPNAVGVDIGCGMIARRTDVEAASLSREDLQRIREAIHARVPVGFNGHAEPQSAPIFKGDAAPPPVVFQNWQAAQSQMGTLGGGNHFIELQKDEDGLLWIMIHSGSRSIGKKVCDFYDAEAKKLCGRWRSPLPDKDLAFLPEDEPLHDAYLAEMNWCLSFAEQSRDLMMERTVEAIAEVRRRECNWGSPIHTHHNYAAMEHHLGQNVLVHRKGAVKAIGKVIIPGSMGTASYIAEGLGEKLSFGSCSHGAGRVMGRKQANKTITKEQAQASMAHVVFGIRDGDYEEMPPAYKDVDAVMANQVDLVKPLHRLVPLAVVKG